MHLDMKPVLFGSASLMGIGRTLVDFRGTCFELEPGPFERNLDENEHA